MNNETTSLSYIHGVIEN